MRRPIESWLRTNAFSMIKSLFVYVIFQLLTVKLVDAFVFEGIVYFPTATDPPLRPVALVAMSVVAVIEGAAPANRLPRPKLVADVDVQAILDVQIACGS